MFGAELIRDPPLLLLSVLCSPRSSNAGQDFERGTVADCVLPQELEQATAVQHYIKVSVEIGSSMKFLHYLSLTSLHDLLPDNLGEIRENHI